MEDRTNVIHIESLSRSFRIGESEVQALKNVNLTVNEGEFLGILGPSGSGKSTLMDLLTKIEYRLRNHSFSPHFIRIYCRKDGLSHPLEV